MPTTRLAHRAALKDTRVNIRLQEIADSLPDVIRMGRGDPDFDTPAHIVRAGQEALAKGATHYTHAQGILPLRQAIAKDILARGGASYTPEQIVVTPGAQQALFTVALGLLDLGDEMLAACPGYHPYHQAAELAGGRVVDIRTTMATNFTLTAEMVEAHLTPKTKILVVVNPSNPTGTVTPPGEVARIAAVARAHDLLVISDEIYAQLTYGDARIQPVASLPGMAERTITISGFSKTYAMTGWRVGYFAAPADLVPALAAVHNGLAISTAAVSQHAALAALTGPQDCVADMRRTYDERRVALCEGLRSMGIPYADPQGAFFVYANVSGVGMGATAFCEKVLREGRVLVFPGVVYGDYTDDFVRLSLTQPVDKIREACARMAAVVASIRESA
ncbi:MAG: aminotransferase [Acidobacterium sp.]|nr:pyridoxal phosphate-dependent aminotransferase [Acidobacteriota bacterium]PHY11697.1 MAG: aminotransferase [Acidobacterium sp.]